MRTKKQTIILSKIRAHLRFLARKKYRWIFSESMEEDINRKSKKIYELFEQ